MVAPRIRAYDSRYDGPVANERPGDAARFVVERAGEFLGRVYSRGDVIVIGGKGRVGDAVVLGARGLGRPRLGTLTDDGLRGEAGERCSLTRWHALGRVIRVEAAPPELAPDGTNGDTTEVARGGQLTLVWAGRQAA